MSGTPGERFGDRPHPSWCQPTRCEAGLGRAHSSEVMTIVRDRRGGSTARLALRLYAFEIAVPMVEIVVGDHGLAQRVRVDASLRQAEALRAGLAVLLEKAQDAR